VRTWLLDTGPLVAFFDRSDKYHDWTVNQWSRAPIPMLTCEGVIAEAAYLLEEHAAASGELILRLFERKVITLGLNLEKEAGNISRLLTRYADQKMQLADACLVRMSEITRDCEVLTLDRKDFRVYRRFDRQLIPIITPE
jgi:predicted nucleic acid-binding protein